MDSTFWVRIDLKPNVLVGYTHRGAGRAKSSDLCTLLWQHTLLATGVLANLGSGAKQASLEGAAVLGIIAEIDCMRALA